MRDDIPHIDLRLKIRVRQYILDKAREDLIQPYSSAEDDRVANRVIDEVRNCSEGYVRVSDSVLDYIINALAEGVERYLDHLEEIT